MIVRTFDTASAVRAFRVLHGVVFVQGHRLQRIDQLAGGSLFRP